MIRTTEPGVKLSPSIRWAIEQKALGQSMGIGPDGREQQYRYDAIGRLIGSQHGDNAHRYSIDAAGNRLEQGIDKQQGLTDNRLTQLNGARYRYDGAGNLIERQQPNGERLTLGYDGANRLVHLIHASELGATREATYRYDGLGRRISKTVRHQRHHRHHPLRLGR